MKQTLTEEIEKLLHTPELARYRKAVIKLIENFEGIDVVIEQPEDRTQAVVKEVLTLCSKAPSESRAEELRNALTHLPLFNRCAGVKGERWNPLKESFQDFEKRHGGIVPTWYDWEQYPSPDEVSKWLERYLST